ncbi:FeoA family protein [Aquabacterium humicola]|uniref:FeoA family protein n=1 Tax=Aquabacterium humicola TaxID=3237377 RepID=UPI002542FAEC|nr:FeoA family protein [Rubrivivax pictus]
MTATAPPLTLADLALHRPATVRAIAPPPHAPEWAQRLAEIGFIEGEPVTLMARAWPGHDPLVVRIGDSTFALRRAEARCIRVLTPS